MMVPVLSSTKNISLISQFKTCSILDQELACGAFTYTHHDGCWCCEPAHRDKAITNTVTIAKMPIFRPLGPPQIHQAKKVMIAISMWEQRFRQFGPMVLGEELWTHCASCTLCIICESMVSEPLSLLQTEGFLFD
ncbi:MAG: hypothetical protein R2778_09385 [Saprospiraceae bacterium]